MVGRGRARRRKERNKFKTRICNRQLPAQPSVIKIQGLLSAAARRDPPRGRRQTQTLPCCVSHLEPGANAAPMLLTPHPKPSAFFSPSPHHFSIPFAAPPPPDYTSHLSNTSSYFFPPILLSQVRNFLRLQISPTHLMPSAKSKPLPSASYSGFSPSTNLDCSGDDTGKLVCYSVWMN